MQVQQTFALDHFLHLLHSPVHRSALCWWSITSKYATTEIYVSGSYFVLYVSYNNCLQYQLQKFVAAVYCTAKLAIHNIFSIQAELQQPNKFSENLINGW